MRRCCTTVLNAGISSVREGPRGAPPQLPRLSAGGGLSELYQQAIAEPAMDDRGKHLLQFIPMVGRRLGARWSGPG